MNQQEFERFRREFLNQASVHMKNLFDSMIAPVLSEEEAPISDSEAIKEFLTRECCIESTLKITSKDLYNAFIERTGRHISHIAFSREVNAIKDLIGLDFELKQKQNVSTWVGLNLIEGGNQNDT
ncbi:hypothetical protein SAMN00017405_0688 [Desulfonispora thiosulfatigenes DSM 11270]|uniref:Uncharacterized protein n=1 Tax=Desulfonispora thiosulfatigenes DSM 11270 TaxID=656914 RepID=A0A1W1V9C0_DESTI|nr:hypothetical protein [Desulfonispora thiosulfatigenes]SMB89962.1 hypothetical protein SAMN00017405_0688 [Desulfonispora thiosulfatigenes DSM 11270]